MGPHGSETVSPVGSGGKGLLLGVDIGTYESKGLLVEPNGCLVASHAVPHELLLPRQGWAEHDAESVWWGDLCTLTKALLAQSRRDPKDILAVGCSSIAPDMLPVDDAGLPLRNAVLYGIDTRAQAEIRELEERIGGRTIFDRTGNALSAQSVGPKILWLARNEPEVYWRTRRFVTGTTFLVGRLTGRWVVDHYTASCMGPFYEPSKGAWAEDLCSGIVETGRLPEIVWTAQIAGGVTREAARATGLAEGTPVIAGTADAAAEAVSVGVVASGRAMLMYGSTMFYIQATDAPLRDLRLWSAPYLFPGTHAMMGGMATTGALTRWFRDQLARDEGRGGDAYARLAEGAASVPPGAEGLLALPYFSGERTPINDPLARGVFFGLTLSHTREHLYRAVLEGVGHGIRQHLDLLESLGHPPRRLMAVGGGTKNQPWLQMVSDISGRAQTVPSVTWGAAYGDAFLAGMGAGLFREPAEADRWVEDRETVCPDPGLKAYYDRCHELYLELYERNRELMHALSSLARS